MTTTRNDEFAFEALPAELQQLVGSWLDKTALFRLASTDRAQFRLHEHELFKRFMASHHIIQIDGATVSRTFYLSSEGFVFACGRNGNRGLGLGDDQPRKLPTRVPGLSNIKLMCSSHRQIVFLGHDGKVWEIQNGAPQLIKDLPLITGLVGDSSAIVLLAQDGRVFVSGNNDFGIFGIPGRQHIISFEAVPGFENIISVLLTPYSMICTDRQGRVIVSGANRKAQLALRDQVNRDVPTVIPPLSNESSAVKKAWSNGFTTFLQTVTGDVFVCGGNEHGESGTGVVSEQCVNPTLVPQLKDVLEIYFYSRSAYALTPEGRVLSWGENDKGQLGLGDTKDRSFPTLTALPPIANIDFLEGKVLFFSKEGTTFVCGERINVLPGMEQRPPNSAIPLLVPRLEKIKKDHAGLGVFTFLRQDGVAFVWGNNSHYALGVEDDAVSVPLQLIELPPIRKYTSELSPQVLLHYANQGTDHLHDVCFNLALRKLRFSMKQEDIKNILPLLYADRCRKDERIRTMFPGYQLLPQDAPPELINAYAALLSIYNTLTRTLLRADDQRNFISMLQYIIEPEESREPREKREDRTEKRSRFECDEDLLMDLDEREQRHDDRFSARKRMPKQATKSLKRFGAFADKVQAIPMATLKPAADILLHSLPMLPLPEKRKAEEEVKCDADVQRQPKKAKV